MKNATAKIKVAELKSTVELTAAEVAENADRAAKGFAPYVKVACKCGAVSPFGTQDELAVSRWTVYAGQKGVRCPKH